MDIIILLIAFVTLALTSLRWGVNSTDDMNSREWERRQRWYELHSKEDVWPHVL